MIYRMNLDSEENLEFFNLLYEPSNAHFCSGENELEKKQKFLEGPDIIWPLKFLLQHWKQFSQKIEK